MYEDIAILSYQNSGKMLAAIFLSIFLSILIYFFIMDVLNRKRYSKLKKARSLIEAGHSKAMLEKEQLEKSEADDIGSENEVKNDKS